MAALCFISFSHYCDLILWRSVYLISCRSVMWFEKSSLNDRSIISEWCCVWFHLWLAGCWRWGGAAKTRRSAIRAYKHARFLQDHANWVLFVFCFFMFSVFSRLCRCTICGLRSWGKLMPQNVLHWSNVLDTMAMIYHISYIIYHILYNILYILYII